MFNNIFETTFSDMRTICLNVPSEDYFFSYSSLTKENAKDLVNNYFTVKSRDGIPVVNDVSYDENTNMIRIHLTVDYDKSLSNRSYEIPDFNSMGAFYD